MWFEFSELKVVKIWQYDPREIHIGALFLTSVLLKLGEHESNPPGKLPRIIPSEHIVVFLMSECASQTIGMCTWSQDEVAS